MTDHPITPPRELVRQWAEEDTGGPGWASRIATRAAQWGANAELEACCDWLCHEYGYGEELALKLRAARRPPPPSLEKEACKLLESHLDTLGVKLTTSQRNTIRRELEALFNG
jgi:hypothetical protein